jgi:hypothetical protein
MVFSYALDKDLISRIYKELQKLDTNRINNTLINRPINLIFLRRRSISNQKIN